MASVQSTVDDRKMALFAGMVKIELPAAGSTKDMLRAAMRAVKTHWHLAVESEDTQFRAAVGAVLLWLHEQGDTEATARITGELQILNALSAGCAGVPVDWAAVANDSKAQEPFGLLAIWKEEPAKAPAPGAEGT